MSTSGVDGVAANDVILFPIYADLSNGTKYCHIQADVRLLVPKIKVPAQFIGGFFVTGSPTVVTIQKDAEEQESQSILNESGGGAGSMKEAASVGADVMSVANSDISGLDLYGDTGISLGFYFDVLKLITVTQPWLTYGTFALISLVVLYRRGIA